MQVSFLDSVMGLGESLHSPDSGFAEHMRDESHRPAQEEKSSPFFTLIPLIDQ